MPDEPELGQFHNNNAQLDGLDLSNTDVQYNVFIYSGGPPPILANSVFANNTIYFTDAAANTLGFLAMLVRTAQLEERIVMLRAWGLLRETETITLITGDAAGVQDNG